MGHKEQSTNLDKFLNLRDLNNLVSGSSRFENKTSKENKIKNLIVMIAESTNLLRLDWVQKKLESRWKKIFSKNYEPFVI